MKTNDFQNLLAQVNTLTRHYKKINALTGEDFNIFKILKLESSEVRLHSAFLAALLDPNGSHGQQDRFLKLFKDLFCFKENEFDTASGRVDIEKYTGSIGEDGNDGGRIDIIVSDGSDNHIILENKIYAGDQTNQLTRYYNHSPNADLLYLTLDGKLPTKESCGALNNDEHFKCISYKTDIIKWLEECRKEAVLSPIVRESITQYINLIKHLTNQTLNHSMEKELNELLKSNLEASFIITDNLDQSLKEITHDFVFSLKNYCLDLGLSCDSTLDLDKNYTSIRFSKPEWKYVFLEFQFQSYDKDLIYGFSIRQKQVPEELLNQLKAIPNRISKPNQYWPWYQRVEAPYNNWSKYDAWKAILDGRMLNVMGEKINYLLDSSKGFEL